MGAVVSPIQRQRPCEQRALTAYLAFWLGTSRPSLKAQSVLADTNLNWDTYTICVRVPPVRSKQNGRRDDEEILRSAGLMFVS